MIAKHRSMLTVLIGLAMVMSVIIVRAQSAQVLTFWARYDPEEAQPILDAYNARLQTDGKNIRWEYTEVDSAGLATRLSAGQAPDAVGFDLVLGPQLSMSGRFLDLTDRFNALSYHSLINPTMLNLGSENGVVYAVPTIADVSVLVYNRRLLKDVGVDPDQALETWDGLRSAAQKLTQNGTVGYELWCGDGGWLMFTVMPFVWANGGTLLSADGTQATLDDPKTAEAIQFLADINLQDHSTAPQGTTEGCAESSFDESSPNFERGTLAIEPRSSASIAALILEHPELDLGVALFPGRNANTKSSFIGGDLTAIPTGSAHSDEAWDLIQYLLSAEVQVDIFAQAGYVPVHADFADYPVSDGDPRFTVFAEALRVGTVPSNPRYVDLYAPFQTGMQAALNGDQSVPEALAAANSQIQQMLDQHP